MSQHTVLFELGCEELPPKSLKTLRDALQAETIKGLNDAGLNFASVEAYAAPRRLALKIVNVDGAQADTQKRFDGTQFRRYMTAKANRPKPLKALCAVKALRRIKYRAFRLVKLRKSATTKTSK